ncbi:hypothetical protein EDC53_101568 [Phytobacter diazotrophicus]|nr:hypothetical protein EDC53_101568 [Phytobacter diazotrophicus]
MTLVITDGEFWGWRSLNKLFKRLNLNGFIQFNFQLCT